MRYNLPWPEQNGAAIRLLPVEIFVAEMLLFSMKWYLTVILAMADSILEHHVS
jgi:hypothetical protein